jgi:CRP-like cAMP-binding protein
MNAILKSKIEDNLNHLHFYTGLNFNALPEQEKSFLEAQAKTIRFPKKSVLYSEGEAPKGVYILLSGKVKFSQLNLDGNVQILFIYSSGDMFGYRPILSDDNHFVSAIALEECEMLYIERDNFLNIVSTSDRLSNLILKSICHEYTVLANRINIFAQKTIKERLAYFLLILNDKYKVPNQTTDGAEIKVNRSDLASYIGTSLENIVRTVKEFKNKDYIRTDGKSIYINDFEALYSLTGV